jgi:AcrR family transcriptional regulator
MTERRGRPRASGAQLGDLGARTRILQGAAYVFADVGVRAAAVEDILKAAGVSRRTFYRFYENKEAVMVALYQMGTDALLGACAVAVSEGKTPRERVEGCIDAHLRNSRDFGRLVFVLGGEAHRQESSLHARRMEVHEALARLFGTAVGDRKGPPLDPLLFRALVLAVEGVARMILEEGDEGRAVSPESISRGRRVMVHLVSSALGLGPAD